MSTEIRRRWHARSTEDRFWAKVDKSGACWMWTAHKDSAGYGRFQVNGRPQWAHRVAYVLAHGAIPDGFVIDHVCKQRACVNPAHLEAVTQKENVSRGNLAAVTRARHAQKTHCPQGHEWSGANIYTSPSGKRGCRACWAYRRERKRAA